MIISYSFIKFSLVTQYCFVTPTLSSTARSKPMITPRFSTHLTTVPIFKFITTIRSSQRWYHMAFHAKNILSKKHLAPISLYLELFEFKKMFISRFHEIRIHLYCISQDHVIRSIFFYHIDIFFRVREGIYDPRGKDDRREI